MLRNWLGVVRHILASIGKFTGRPTDRLRIDHEGRYPTTGQFNVYCVDDIILNRATIRDIRELRAETIQSIWSLKERRELTREEISKLCVGR